MREINVVVNGSPTTACVPVRMLLADFLRNDLRLTGTHLGCEHGYCGSCTVLVDGVSVRSCLTLAVQTDGKAVDTIESLADADGLHPIQQAFEDCHGLQCGFCTPGMVMSLVEMAATNAEYSRDEIRQHLAGNLCRCTGYHQIVDAAEKALKTGDSHGE